MEIREARKMKTISEIPVKDSIRGRKDLPHLIGYLKHVIGMCVDEDPHREIREHLWKITEMAYVIMNRK